MSKPVIKMQDVSLSYGQGTSAEIEVLKNIDLEIYENEYVIFFGPSGSGKSTLLYIIAGLEIPTQGAVIFRDPKHGIKRDLSTLSEEDLMEYHKSFIGMIFQAFYLIPSLTAKNNITLPATLHGFKPDEREQSAEKLMRRFGIADFKDRYPGQLSGGQQQRVAIARSLINNPAVVLADEPVGNLDSENAAIVVDMISDLNRTDNKTVIHVTHDPRHLSLADRVFYIKDGSIDRVVVNRRVQHPSKYKGMSRHSAVVDKITAMNPYATDAQIKTKLVLDQVLLTYSHHQMDHIEEIVSKFLTKQISRNQMQELFDLPEEKGGVGLYRQTAQKLAREIAELVVEIEEVGKEESAGVALKDQAKQLLYYLLDEHDIKITAMQEQRAIEATAYRLSGAIGEEEFRSILDEPLDEGGVGLHKRIAERLAGETEVLLVEIAM